MYNNKNIVIWYNRNHYSTENRDFKIKTRYKHFIILLNTNYTRCNLFVHIYSYRDPIAVLAKLFNYIIFIIINLNFNTVYVIYIIGIGGL